MPHCLVVDDSDVVRKVARRILESLKYSVSEAENGEVALELCRRGMPEVILLDWQMPVMGAIEFLHALIAEFPERGCHIIYCTSENDPADIARAFGAGADDYILKPYNRADLEARLAEPRPRKPAAGKLGPVPAPRSFAAAR